MKDSGWKVILCTVIVGLVLFAWANIALAASSGPNDCTVSPGAGTAEDPWLDDAWEDADHSSCADDEAPNDVSSNSFDSGDQSYVLYHSGFGFSISGTIDGVTVNINAWHSNGNGDIDLCQLLDVDGARVGTNLCAAAPQALDLIDTNVETIGSTSELWGNSLTDTWVNDADFGIALGILNGGNNQNVFIDNVTITIEYTSGGAAARRRMIMQ